MHLSKKILHLKYRILFSLKYFLLQDIVAEMQERIHYSVKLLLYSYDGTPGFKKVYIMALKT